MKCLAILGCAAALAGCVAYDPYYPYYGYGGGTAATFNQAWNAAGGAMQDQGVQITREDRSAGIIEGTRGSQRVSSRVITQNDGRVRVEFNVGSAQDDPGMPDRLSRSYDARMGR
jgi:hypothetical protein